MRCQRDLPAVMRLPLRDRAITRKRPRASSGRVPAGFSLRSAHPVVRAPACSRESAHDSRARFAHDSRAAEAFNAQRQDSRRVQSLHTPHARARAGHRCLSVQFLGDLERSGGALNSRAIRSPPAPLRFCPVRHRASPAAHRVRRARVLSNLYILWCPAKCRYSMWYSMDHGDLTSTPQT